MTYKVLAEFLNICEVNANSEEEALQIVKSQLSQQYPKEIIRTSIISNN